MWFLTTIHIVLFELLAMEGFSYLNAVVVICKWRKIGELYSDLKLCVFNAQPISSLIKHHQKMGILIFSALSLEPRVDIFPTYLFDSLYALFKSKNSGCLFLNVTTASLQKKKLLWVSNIEFNLVLNTVYWLHIFYCW